MQNRLQRSGAVEMYFAMIVALMGVLPVVSIVLDISLVHSSGDLLVSVGRWFVFWSVGMRLAVAGIRQIAKPAFTAETIFGTTDAGAIKIVFELGFANLAMGLVGLLSVFLHPWVMPAAVCGGLYLGLAGLKHVANGHRGPEENAAMISDLFVFAALAVYVGGMVLRGSVG